MLQLAGIVGARGRSIHAIRAARALIGRGLVLLATALLLLTWQAAAQAEAEFLEPEKAFVFSAQMAAPDTLELHYKVAPGYYMYRERFGITISPIGATTLGEAVYPKGEVKYDPTFEKDMEVFHKDVMIRVPVGAGGQPFTLTLTGQGCADAGLCYPPMDSSVKLTPVAGGYALADGAGAQAAPTASSGGLSALVKAGDTGLADALGGLGWAKTAGVFLILGLLLAFTPCVLPMIPILSSIVLGGATQARPSRGRGLALAATYVLGMSVVYTALGVAAGLSGCRPRGS
jgi:thiol:disulfide interchange protein DsbD